MVFARRTDGFQALKRYNNVQLDGKPMKIEIVGSNTQIPMLARVNVVGGTNGRRTVVMKYALIFCFFTPMFFLLFVLFFILVCPPAL